MTRATLDFSGVTKVGCDETSARRGQDYVSLFMDLEARRVMFATPGRDAEHGQGLRRGPGGPRRRAKDPGRRGVL